MVVECPKCKSRLKVADEKIAPGGSKFRCPKCAGVLTVRRPGAPAEKPAKALDKGKVIAAHGDPEVLNRLKSALKATGAEVLSSADGVDMIIKTLRELPHLAVVDVALPKIYGFEVCKRLRARPETKEMKMILISSVYDKKRYRREPVSLYGADAYVDEHAIEDELLKKIESIMETGGVQAPAPSQAARPLPAPGPQPSAAPQALPTGGQAAPGPIPPVVGAAPPISERAVPAAGDATVERARRFVRAMLSDLYLYSAPKVESSIKSNTFREAFAQELKEGLKIYESRIIPEVRSKGDFFNEGIEDFIRTRKKSFGL